MFSNLHRILDCRFSKSYCALIWDYTSRIWKLYLTVNFFYLFFKKETQTWKIDRRETFQWYLTKLCVPSNISWASPCSKMLVSLLIFDDVIKNVWSKIFNTPYGIFLFGPYQENWDEYIWLSLAGRLFIYLWHGHYW